MTTLRLIFPQWQGGKSANIARYVPELAPADAATGYHIGAQLLAWLAPPHTGPTATVPVSLDCADTAEAHGIFAYQAVKQQLAEALAIINRHAPDKILTLGGECSVSVAPFSYLAARYPGDVAVLWLDAHPDLRVLHEDYSGFHAMTLATLLGHGERAIIDSLPATIAADKALIVGLRSPEGGDMQRPARYGVHWLPAAAANEGGADILNWLDKSGAKKIAIHLDLDGLDPRDLILGVAHDTDGLRLDATVQLINTLAAHYELVGLTIAEPMPREVIKLRNLLHGLPPLA